MPTRSTALANPDPEPRARITYGAVVSVGDMLEDLGRKLATRRARRGLTRTELANRIHCSRYVVHNAELGRPISFRNFWELADTALQANGALLAAADRISLRQAAAKRERLSERPPTVDEALKLARYRQVQRTHRVFADRLSTTAISRQRCPHMTEMAANQRTRIEHELAALTATARTLLRRPDFTAHEVLTDLWRTLLTHDPYHASFLSAVALLELAQARP